MMMRLAPPAKLFPAAAGEIGGWWSCAGPVARNPRASSSSFCQQDRLRQQQQRNLARISSCGSRDSSSSSSGYRKVPLETAGAYRLIDDDTGDSVIVWGGADDQDPPHIPSKEALFFVPSPAASTNSSSGTPPAVSHRHRAGAAIGSFGKLKAHKVKALFLRRNRNMKSNSPHEDGDESAAYVDDVHTEPEEEEDVYPPLVRSRRASKSNFSRVLQRQQESKDRLLARDSPQISPLASPPPPPYPPAMKRGWGVDATNTSRFKQQRDRQSSSVTTDGGFFSRKSFKELGCSDDIIEALRKQLFRRPSHIQAMSYAPILEGKSCIIADQSGSGKTLAYLTPVIQCLRQEELLGIAKSTSKNPRVVILVPTAELASQVLNNCRSMAKFGVPFRSIVATGGFRQKTQLESLQQELDVLIATPGRFIYLLKEGFLELANLKCVVLDEVDILFNDEEFEDVLQNLISCAPVATQYLFVTATLPVDIYNKLVDVFPDSEVVMGPGMHRTSSGLEEVLVDCSGNEEEKSPDTAFLNKKSALLRLVEESPVSRTIVFCNKIETSRKVENALKRYDRKGIRIQVLPFHSALEQELRLSNMKEFLNSKTSDPLFLVCTDRASRGIDFRAVDHVVLFDFPRDPSEYVRRVGRGAGGTVKAFVFAVGKHLLLGGSSRGTKEGIPCTIYLVSISFRATTTELLSKP